MAPNVFRFDLPMRCLSFVATENENASNMMLYCWDSLATSVWSKPRLLFRRRFQGCAYFLGGDAFGRAGGRRGMSEEISPWFRKKKCLDHGVGKVPWDWVSNGLSQAPRPSLKGFLYLPRFRKLLVSLKGWAMGGGLGMVWCRIGGPPRFREIWL